MNPAKMHRKSGSLTCLHEENSAMCISRLRCAVRVLLGICLLSWTLLPARAQPNQGLERRETLRCASTGDTIPSGLAVVLPSGEKHYQSMNLQVLNNPFMSGVAVQINWRDIEPVQGKPDWSKLDALFAAAESSKKWVQLTIFPGFFSPAWALEGAQDRSVQDPIWAWHRAPSRGFRCHGIACTSTVGSHS